MRVVFMGSPEFAIPTLAGLVGRTELVGVVTQPDRPAGRGRETTASPVKQFAIQRGFELIQPVRLRDPQAVAELVRLAPDLIVVAAYGQILPPSVLEIPPRGCLNVHASLLPRWRGAAPVQAAILEGDSESGASIMVMDSGLDTGPILAQRSTPILAEDTGGSLGTRLAQLGAELLVELLPQFLSGALRPTPQDRTLATLAPRLKKTSGLIDFDLPAERLARQVRAFEPWPGTYLDWEGRRLIVRAAHAAAVNRIPQGQAFELDELPALATSEGALVLDRVQLAGKRPLDGKTFLRTWPAFLTTRWTE